ncbi:unnamed protein product [Rotaria sp. Silwood1]|nr:unnamed protein product [Rotaria sp. Silwood1]CAF5050970.1 unnamed protein product [Rotaria sp. Silwood1]
MGIAVCGSGVGTMALTFIMNGIVNIRSWLSYENALLLESGIIMISLLCGFLMLPLPQEASEQRRLERKVRKEGQQKQNEELLIVQNGSTTSKNNSTEGKTEEPHNGATIVATPEIINVIANKKSRFT